MFGCLLLTFPYRYFISSNFYYDRSCPLSEIKFKYLVSNVDFVFIGDSILSDNCWSESLSNSSVINFSVGGFTSYDVKENLNEVKSLSPKNVFIMIGINDIASEFKIHDTMDNLENIISNLKGINTKVNVMSVLYTHDKELNRRVFLLNNMIDSLSKNEKFDVYNLNHLLSSNRLLLDKYTYDGVHLNNDGYEVISKFIMDSYK